jgi:uncharacterized protein (DUF983 family)
MSKLTVNCPFCGQEMTVDQPDDYSPVFHHCQCGERFIVERTQSGVDVMKEGEAPCCSNPECRCIEISAGDD